MGSTKEQWPQFNVDAAGARVLSLTTPVVDSRVNNQNDDSLVTQVETLSEKLNVLTATVESRPTPEAASISAELERDVRWMKVRVMGLEQALEESHLETKTLIEYLELCFDALKSQDDRLSTRHQRLQNELDRLLERSSTYDRDLMSVRAHQNASGERTEILAAELLELAHQTSILASEAQQRSSLTARESEQLASELREANRVAQLLAGQAQESASMTAAESAQLATELREAVEAAQALANKAKQTADLTADGSEQLALELREARVVAEQANDRSALTAKEATQIAQELREANAIAQQLAEQANQTAELTAEEAEQTAKELREANEEARVMAEKATDRADFSADSVAGLQVDFEEETAALHRRLLDTATQAELAEIERAHEQEQQRTSELLESAQSGLDEASSRIGELEHRESESSPEKYASSLREEIERELTSLRAKMDSPSEGAEDQAAPVKRWQHHLAEEAPTAATPKQLPSVNSANTADSETTDRA